MNTNMDASLNTCKKCGLDGHVQKDCEEKRLSKIWPGQFVFRGKIRTPDGGTIGLEMPLGILGRAICAELVLICAKGGEIIDSSKVVLLGRLRAIGQRIVDQDNQSTHNPIFLVQESRVERGKERWKFVTACFTESACEDFIRENSHNFKKLRVYVASGAGNREWALVRELLQDMAIAKRP